MSATMAVENLFARESDFDRTSREHREFTYDKFMVEWITFAAKAAAVWRGNHADVTSRHLEDFGQRAVDVMWRLRRTPKCQLPIGIEECNRGMLLQRHMSIAFIKQRIFANSISFSETFFNLPTFER